ncbi:MAG: hypothetical protein PVH19_11530 [Planctomycetia bacterium]|jgi:hypothetical protein
MRETLQAFIAFMMIVLAVVAGAVWFNKSATSTQMLWVFRIVCPVLAIALLFVLIQMWQRKDLLPDYLSMNFGSSNFEQNGVQFHLSTERREDDSFWLVIHFQNKYENSCSVNITLYPTRPPRLRPVSAKFNCEAAAFGVAKVPLILDSSARGQRSTWEVGATVHYPHGKRKQFRFRQGREVPTNLDLKKTDSRLFRVLLILNLINWKIIRTHSFTIPQHIDPNFAMDQITETQTLWKLGDPPLT